MKELKWSDGESTHDLDCELVECDGDDEFPLAIVGPHEYDDDSYEGVVVIMIGRHDNLDAAKKVAVDILKRSELVTEGPDGKLYKAGH